MISQDGTIHFAEELLDLVERFLEDYEDIEGRVQNELDRGLVIAFALCAMRCDLDLLAQCVDGSQVFGRLSPRKVLDECADRDPIKRAARRAEAAKALEARGLLEPARRRHSL